MEADQEENQAARGRRLTNWESILGAYFNYAYPRETTEM